MIQEPFSDDASGRPLEPNGPALPGPQEGNPASFKRCQGIVCPRSGHSLADYDGPGSGPGVEHRRVRRPAAMKGALAAPTPARSHMRRGGSSGRPLEAVWASGCLRLRLTI
jgi:hypothetical protein